MEEHIPLSERKQLCARIVYLDATEPLAREAKARHPEDFAYLQDRFFSMIDRNVDQPSKTYPLDKFLRDSFARFDPTLNEPTVPKSLGDSIRTALESRVRQVDCAACSHKCSLTSICDDGAHDHQLVAGCGLCIRPLREMFDLAEAVARMYYEKYAKLETQYPKVIFSTHFKRDPKKLHDFPVDFYITGKTQYMRCGERVQIQLILTPKAFNLATYAATPYVMFHEFIAHAFTALYPEPPDSLKCSAQDHFGEGWMDFVALKVMQEVFDGVGPAASLRSRMPFLTQGIRQAETFHNARVDWTADNASKDSPYISLGADAAKYFFDLLKTRFNITKAEEQLEVFYRMSFEINLITDTDAARKDAFVTMIDELSHLPAVGERTANESLILDIIARYLQTKDINALLDRAIDFRESTPEF